MKTSKVLLVSACALVACAQKVPQKPVPAVRVEVVSSGTTASGKVAYSAVAQPYTTTQLAFRGSGYVVQLMTVPTPGGGTRELGEGDRVKRGDVVARIRDSEYRDKVEQAAGQLRAAQATAEKARLDFERTTRLFATQSVTKPEMDSATAAYKATQADVASAEAALQEAQVSLRDTALVAPVDSEVIKKSIELGTYMSPGSPGFVIGDVSKIKVILGLPDVAVAQVKLGQPVTVTTEALPGRTFEGHVSRIAAAADPVTRNFDVQVDFPNADRLWKPGMIAAVELGSIAPGAAVPLLPLTSFVAAPGAKDRFAVMLVDGDGSQARAKLQEVALGDVIGNRVAVTKGLTVGERVVTQGASMVNDGERIEVMPAEAP
ncbi:MAG TPA: efflux RND transporter periplasmic adaptor subunit [Myxococcales bacterium]|nr:efflux RND transporter periplasmic adaptor subunit [Myxococcales bacterium]